MLEKLVRERDVLFEKGFQWKEEKELGIICMT